MPNADTILGRTMDDVSLITAANDEEVDTADRIPEEGQQSHQPEVPRPTFDRLTRHCACPTVGLSQLLRV